MEQVRFFFLNLFGTYQVVKSKEVRKKCNVDSKPCPPHTPHLPARLLSWQQDGGHFSLHLFPDSWIPARQQMACVDDYLHFAAVYLN